MDTIQQFQLTFSGTVIVTLDVMTPEGSKVCIQWTQDDRPFLVLGETLSEAMRKAIRLREDIVTTVGDKDLLVGDNDDDH